MSNYPGTTVEVSGGQGKIGKKEFEVVDTPGMYSLFPISEDERVDRAILLKEKPEVVVQLVDSKNLEKMLPLTLQLSEAGLLVLLNLNMMDEAEELAIDIDVRRLEEMLSIPVVATVATTGRGMRTLKESILNYSKSS